MVNGWNTFPRRLIAKTEEMVAAAEAAAAADSRENQ